jgi:hypothetical protein
MWPHSLQCFFPSFQVSIAEPQQDEAFVLAMVNLLFD